jgi:hypothetical protein
MERKKEQKGQFLLASKRNLIQWNRTVDFTSKVLTLEERINEKKSNNLPS